MPALGEEHSGQGYGQCEALSCEQAHMLPISKEAGGAGAEYWGEGRLRADDILQVIKDQVT